MSSSIELHTYSEESSDVNNFDMLAFLACTVQSTYTGMSHINNELDMHRAVRAPCLPGKWSRVVTIQNDWKADYVPCQIRRKFAPLSLILNMGPPLKYCPSDPSTCSCHEGFFFFFLIFLFTLLQPFWHWKVRNHQYQTFSDLNFVICKGYQIKAIINISTILSTITLCNC